MNFEIQLILIENGKGEEKLDSFKKRKREFKQIKILV